MFMFSSLSFKTFYFGICIPILLDSNTKVIRGPDGPEGSQSSLSLGQHNSVLTVIIDMGPQISTY